MSHKPRCTVVCTHVLIAKHWRQIFFDKKSLLNCSYYLRRVYCSRSINAQIDVIVGCDFFNHILVHFAANMLPIHIGDNLPVA